MPIESATYLSQLDAANPTSADPKSEGDNHLRLVKAALKATFPSFGAYALNATQAQIDSLVSSIFVQVGGNIGIGTSSPSFQVEIFKTSGAAQLGIVSANNSHSELYFGDTDSKTIAALSYSHANNSLSTYVNGAERVRIDDSGNMNVAQSAAGFANSNSHSLATNGALYTNHANGTAAGAAFASYGYNAVGIGSITQSGTTGVSYNTSSDARLKVITGPVTDSGFFIDSLKPKQGFWRADGSRFVGFIAHEFQEVSPSSVTGQKDAVDKDGRPVYMSMQASSPEVVANIVAELQDLRKRLSSLEAARA